MLIVDYYCFWIFLLSGQLLSTLLLRYSIIFVLVKSVPLNFVSSLSVPGQSVITVTIIDKKPAMEANTKTPVMVLQEYTVKQKLASPEYTIEFERHGTHDNEFQYRLTVANIVVFGTGRSKQIAKHEAAQRALDLLAEKGLYKPTGIIVKAPRIESISVRIHCFEYHLFWLQFQNISFWYHIILCNVDRQICVFSCHFYV